MFNNRDLGILGGGALLAVLSLFLPFPFLGRVVAGFLVLVGFMILALLRLGPDRVPPEVWWMRRFRFAVQARRYVNQQAPSQRVEPTRQTPEPTPKPKDPAPARAPEAIPSTDPAFSQVVLHPMDLAWEEIGVYPLLTVGLGVVGVYVVAWLAGGGAQDLSLWFR